MSSNDIAISIRDLSKEYTIVHEEKTRTLAEKLTKRLQNPLRRPRREIFRALSDVTFDVKKGEVVGIVGHNGAGKSTLLKVLSRITEPTSGWIELFGRVGSLLEVGTGFHPELTGRENIFLNGAILGMTRQEIRKQFDAIVDFSAVEKFLDTPVKRYSSGMYVRLAFAVAAHLNPEILIVDEVLSVGDAEFQKRCMGKMRDVSQTEGRAVLLVSHNMAAVESLCQTAVLLNHGKLELVGSPSQVLTRYAGGDSGRRRTLTSKIGVVEVAATDASNSVIDTWRANEPVAIDAKFDLDQDLGELCVDVSMHSSSGVKLLSYQSDRMVPAIRFSSRRFQHRFTVTNPGLSSGTVSIDIGIRQSGSPEYVANWVGALTLPCLQPADGHAGTYGALLSLPITIHTCNEF